MSHTRPTFPFGSDSVDLHNRLRSGLPSGRGVSSPQNLREAGQRCHLLCFHTQREAEVVRVFVDRTAWLIDGLEGLLERMDNDIKVDPKEKASKQHILEFLNFCRNLDLTNLDWLKIRNYELQIEAEYSKYFR